jgi:hypothetical protein
MGTCLALTFGDAFNRFDKVSYLEGKGAVCAVLIRG